MYASQGRIRERYREWRVEREREKKKILLYGEGEGAEGELYEEKEEEKEKLLAVRHDGLEILQSLFT